MPGATGPNHELALVMTKERAGVMAEASVLPLACSVNNTRERICDRPYVDHGTESHNSLGDNVGPDLMGCRGMGTEIGAGLSGTWRTGPNFIETRLQ